MEELDTCEPLQFENILLVLPENREKYHQNHTI